MSNSDYNPNSVDAVLSRIEAKLDSHKHEFAMYRVEDSQAKDAMLAEQRKTNGRVNRLERDQWYQRGFAGAVALGAAGLWHWLTKG